MYFLTSIPPVDEDYTYSINPSEFVFTPDGRSVLSISVEVVDDKVFEGREDFSLILDSPQPRVVFNPQQTSIAITDNEGEGPKIYKIWYAGI